MAEEDHAPIPLVDANAPVIVGDTDTATPSLASFAEDTPAATSMLAKVELDHPGSDAGFPVSAPVPADADVRTLPRVCAEMNEAYAWMTRHKLMPIP
jgi:NADPH-dependent ferric siderophore reductase